MSVRFALYWTSATTSYVGDGVRFAALPLLAAALSSAPGEVAAVSVGVGLPWLLFGLVAGVVVDRLDRLRLMMATQALRAGAGLVLVLGVATDRLGIPGLALLAFALATCEVVYDVGFNSALPAVVARNDLQRANGRLVTAEVLAVELAGPALGGVLFTLAPVLPLAVDSATFLASALLLVPVARAVTVRQPPETSSLRADVLAGLRWFRRHRLVRALTGAAAAVNLGMGGFYAVLVLFARTELGLGPTGYGLLLAGGALGGAAAGPVAGRLSSGPSRRVVVLGAAPAAAACLLAVAFAGRLAVVVVAVALLGWVVTTASVVMVSVRQMLTPDALLGRVVAVHRMCCWGAVPIGAAAAGIVGEAFGVRAAVAACALEVLLVGTVTGAPLLRLRASEFDAAQQPA